VHDHRVRVKRSSPRLAPRLLPRALPPRAPPHPRRSSSLCLSPCAVEALLAGSAPATADAQGAATAPHAHGTSGCVPGIHHGLRARVRTRRVEAVQRFWLADARGARLAKARTINGRTGSTVRSCLLGSFFVFSRVVELSARRLSIAACKPAFWRRSWARRVQPRASWSLSPSVAPRRCSPHLNAFTARDILSVRVFRSVLADSDAGARTVLNCALHIRLLLSTDKCALVQTASASAGTLRARVVVDKLVCRVICVQRMQDELILQEDSRASARICEVLSVREFVVEAKRRRAYTVKAERRRIGRALDVDNNDSRMPRHLRG
jgi:hypothetical protein